MGMNLGRRNKGSYVSPHPTEVNAWPPTLPTKLRAFSLLRSWFQSTYGNRN